MLVEWLKWYYRLGLMVPPPRPSLGHLFGLLTGPIQLGFKPNSFLNKLTLFRFNTNINWFKMILIKTLISQHSSDIFLKLSTHFLFIWHVIRSFDTLSKLPAHHHFPLVYHLFHQYVDFPTTSNLSVQIQSF